MSIGVTITRNQIPQILRDAPAKLDRAIEALAEMGRGRAVELLNTQTPGKRETRYNPRRIVTVSDPGDAPNTDTGFLAASITVQPAGHLARVIAVGAEYGEPLEFGTASTPARPFMTPMADWLEQQAPDVLAAVGRTLA